MSTKPQFNRIYQGDAAALVPTWPTRFVDLLVTDPPYGSDTYYGTHRRRIEGDQNPLVGLRVIASCYRLLKPNATAYVFCGVAHLGFLEHFFLRYSQFRIRDVLVWDKRNGFGFPFRRGYESVLVLEKGKPTYLERGMPTLLSYQRDTTAVHPHAKPVALLERFIQTSSRPGAVVLDPFAGSGSTGVAAARLGRRFVGVEITPGYAAVAQMRLQRALEDAALDAPSQLAA